MSNSADRHRVVLSVAALTLAFGAVFTAPASAATPHHPSSGADVRPAWAPASRVVGCWDAQVVAADGTREAIRFVFGAGGRLVVVASDGTFRGSWQLTGATTFTFTFTRSLVADDGAVVGSLDVTQAANLDVPRTFTSAGTATGYGLDGTQLFTAPVSASAVRHGSD